MPNWCATNYALTGDQAELREFCDMVNSLPSREDVHKNGFGKYWLGNLVALLGADWEKVSCRGAINPDGDACACFCGPSGSGEGQSLVIDDDGAVRFSTETAWDRSRDFEDLVTERFPSLTFSYRSTDEFGNFHVIHDPMGLISRERFEVWIPDHLEFMTADGRGGASVRCTPRGPDRMSNF